MSSGSALELFSPVTRQWFEDSFKAPTAAQEGAWQAIAQGSHALVVAPTGSGKTLAAFLWSLDHLSRSPAADPKARLRTLYISPLKALAVDIERNLRAPLAGMRNAASTSGEGLEEIQIGVRTGDTPANERRRQHTHPPDILITTPESLFLILTSAARESLAGVEAVIVDEIHALAGSKRGSHLALSLERLDALLAKPAQRIGLSATVRPVDEVARFLGGSEREVQVVSPPYDKRFDLSVVVPVEDMANLGEPLEEIPVGRSAASDPPRRTIWPSIEEQLVELVRRHRSTIIFTNSRFLSERLCARINDLAGQQIARSHHGSVSKQQRLVIEEELKAGRLPAVVATSSLELGIDMGAVDLVVQVESPTSVVSGLQRVGRAGHQVGEISRGVIFPKYRGDLVQCAVVAERMKQGAIEQLHVPRNPLDVLAQQIVAMVAMDDCSLDEVDALVRKAAPFEALPAGALEGVVDMLSGLYPSDEFAELRPRINWDRETGLLTPRSNAQRLAVTSGGTIPDRGLFGVFLAGSSGRVGELDEEMVYESRVGDVFALGASSWRIEEITHDRVLVSPAPGEHARMPFWHGDSLGRPAELGRAVGAFLREIGTASSRKARGRLKEVGLDKLAADNLIAYLEEQTAATEMLPDDRTIVVEKFRDELGDWRLCIHSVFGAQVHAPWALAIQGEVGRRLGVEVQTMHADDGIVVRLPDSDEPLAADAFLFDPDEIESAVTAEVGGSALFASRFRECAARALLLPKRRPDRRTPLWQQRQKSADLLQVASRYGSFPVVLETMRECLQDVFDVPGLRQLMAEIRSRRIRVVEVESAKASPFAASLLFGYIGAFMYEGDSPLAERRAQALSLDTSLLAELLGTAELRELLDAQALQEVELELQRLAEGRRLRTPDDVHDALRAMGAMTPGELVARGSPPQWPAALEEGRRVMRIRIAGAEHFAAIEDAGRYRDALGVPLPMGIADAYLVSPEDPIGDLVARYARSHGPFVPGEVSRRLGLGVAVVSEALARLEARGRVVRGEFRPGGSGTEWCDAEVLRLIRRRSVARLRKEAEAVEPQTLGHFLPAWQGVVSSGARGTDAVLRVVEQLQGAKVPASALESLVLSQRVVGYSPILLDQLSAAGEVIWAATEAVGRNDGWVSLYLAADAGLLLPDPQAEDLSENAAAVLHALANGGAMFFRQISESAGFTDDRCLLATLWDLVWAGLITNDTLAPLRAYVKGGVASVRTGSSIRRRGFIAPARRGPPAGAGRWTLLPPRSADSTRRLHATAEQLLDRHGIVTRGAVGSEEVDGGFAAVYPVLKTMGEKGRCRRGYFVEGLGGAQFALPGAVDRLRSADANQPSATVLAAADPANPYGAALAWPQRAAAGRKSHRPGRKTGALVVLVKGSLVVYVERGGRTLLTFSDDPDELQPAFDALALAVREGSLGRLAVEKADGETVLNTPLAGVMESAGFRQTPRGLRLRA